jgi:hypothetical protein
MKRRPKVGTTGEEQFIVERSHDHEHSTLPIHFVSPAHLRHMS